MVVSTQKSPSKPSKEIEENVREWMKCHNSLKYFATTYVYLQDRAKLETVKFEPWDYLLDLFRLYTDPAVKLLIIGKARQLGITYSVVILAVWLCKFFQNAKVLCLSQGEDEAFDVISRCRFVDNQFPEFLRTKREPDQRGHIGFPDTGSEIRALASTEKAGRSTDATLVICDEWEFHPYAEPNFAALKPTIDGGGKFIGLSTADTSKLDTFFKRKYHAARSGMGNFHKVFLPALIRPGRDKKWLDNVTADLSESQSQGEYPLSEDDMLSVVKSRRVLSQDMLNWMKLNAQPPIPHELSEKYKGLVRIFKAPVLGLRYFLFNDPSEGIEDPHAISVHEFITGEQVATSRGKVPADMCARIEDELVRAYNNAWNSHELNARGGGIVSQKLDELDTPNRCPFIDTNGQLNLKGKRGWHTGKTLRDKLIWGLEEVIRLNQMRINDLDFIDEMKNFVQLEGEDPSAPKGGHDDTVFACGGAWQIRKYMPLNSGIVKSYKYRRN